MRVTRLIRWQFRLLTLLMAVLILVLAGVSGWFCYQHRFIWDWTASHRNSVAPETRRLLRSLSVPVEMIAFVADDPVLHQRIRRQIRHYQAVNPRINLRFVDPNLHPQEAQHFGVTHAGEMVIRLGAGQRIVGNISQDALFNALLQLARGKDEWIVFLQGRQERSPFDTGSAGLSRFAQALRQDGFHWVVLNLLKVPQIPENAAVLVIAGGRQHFSLAEADIIHHYLRRGGSILWLHGSDSSHSMNPLAHQLGLRFLPGTVLNADTRLQSLLGLSNPNLLPIISYGLSPITSRLRYQSILPFAMAIAQPAGNSRWQATPLLRTSTHTWQVEALMNDSSAGVEFAPAVANQAGSFIVGESFSHREKPLSRVVVFGSDTFLDNAYLGQGNNLVLGLAAMNWLSHDDRLIQVRQPVAPDIRLQLTSVVGDLLATLFLFVLPLGFFLISGVVWRRRRRSVR